MIRKIIRFLFRISKLLIALFILALVIFTALFIIAMIEYQGVGN